VQLEAVRVAGAFVARLPDLVERLLGPGGDDGAVVALRQGYGQALAAGLMGGGGGEGGDGGDGDEDDRAGELLSRWSVVFLFFSRATNRERTI
jgi:hypothetical protein